MSQPEGLKFSKTHEWVKAESDIATVGIRNMRPRNWATSPWCSCPRSGASPQGR